MSSQFEQVKNWLLNSGLFVYQKDDENYGGVHSFYDIKEQKFSFLYPEITGYYISTMRFLNEHEKNISYIEHAQASADWLIKIYKKHRGIVQGVSDNLSQQKFVFSFDTLICAKGLMDFYMLSKNKIYLDCAKEILTSIMNNALEKDGTIKPFRRADSQNFDESTDVWYKQKGCFHIKNAMTFCQLYEILKEKIFLEYAEKICNTYLIYQGNDGSILLHKNGKTINLHTMCYAMEGLLYTFSANKNDSYLQSCVKAVNWCKSKIESDGGIELWFNSEFRAKASYPVAQLIRIMLLLDKLTQNNEYQNSVRKLYSFLLRYQAKHEKIQQNGGFYEEFYKTLLGWKIRQKLNSWGSMFALQALYWYDNFDKIRFEREIDLLY